MNTRFSEHVRSSSFSLTLSERMIKILYHLAGCGEEDERLNLAPYQALERRGLAKHIDGKGFVVTEEGYLVAELLSLAGYSSGSPPLHQEPETPVRDEKAK